MAASTAVKFSFSEPLDPATVTGSALTLRTTTGGTPVTGTVTYDAATSTAAFTPGADLALTTGYTATVQGVKDLAGNTLAGPVTAAFTTAGLPPKTIGSSTVGTLVDDTDSNHLNGSKVTTGSTAVALTSLSVHVGGVSAAPNNQYQLAVYTDNAGSPGTLVVSTASGTLTPNAWNSLPVTTTLAPNTSYWFVYNSNGTSSTVNNMHYSTGAASSGAYSNTVVPFGTWPTAFGTAVKDSLVYSLYGAY
ncbi:Ig-like domain-containing protein [Kitasatospora arboriphila]